MATEPNSDESPQHDSGLASLSADEAVARPVSGWGWGGGLALVLLTGAWCLCADAWRPEVPASVMDRLVQRSMSSVAVQRLVELGAAGAYRLVLVGAMGWLAWWALPGRGRGWFIQLLRIAGLVLVIGSVTLLRYPSDLGAVSVVPCFTVAAWCYLTARACGRGIWATFAWLLLSSVAACGAVAAVVMAATDIAPLVSGMPTATADDRERWKEMLSNPYDGDPQLSQLRLTGADLTLMASSWLATQPTPVAAEFACDGDDLQSRVTLPVDIPGLGQRHVNLAAQLQPSVAEGRLNPHLLSLQVGNLPVPVALVAHASSAVRTALNSDADIRRVLQSIESLSIADGELLVLCEPDRASQAAAEAVAASPEASEELRELIREYMQRLIEECRDLPEGDGRFLGLLNSAMQIARERSTPDTAAMESRAALIALGIQIGDPRVRRLAGFPPSEPMPRFRYPYDNKVTLRGRNDLARHFFVSAALRALSSEEMTVAVGLLKEHLDSAQGGSGFSFADLSADLAGVSFAKKATADNSSAVELQLRMAEAFTVNDVMPDIEGLPEGLTQEMFREQYGSLTDPRFATMAAEIQRRLKECAVLE